ncbi:MAG: ArsR family transcriptional regulator [Actinobacteria bacterium]|nr:ArsR family transcriptional regulator [Actinomycetota bacterium]
MSVPQLLDLAALACLDDPVRRQLYELVSQQANPVSRDDAVDATGIGRALAAYHLDKLVEAGLLTATYQRPGDRTGPGAGRPAKLYSRSGREFSVTVPPREYELAARLLVRAVEADPSGHSRGALRAAARQFGVDIGSQVVSRRSPGGRRSDTAGLERRDLETVLASYGYEPEHRADGSMRLRNCPFHQLAEQHKETVCGMNLALIDGVATGLKASALHPVLDPQPGYCCVTIDPGQS